MIIRNATPADLAEVIRIYGASGIEDESFTSGQAAEHYAKFAQYPCYRLFVAVSDDRIVGAYSLLIMDNLAKRGKPSGVVEDVAVDPDEQGRGVGRAMMEHALAECRRAGCYKLTLSSNAKREAAHRFYESLGFERHGYSFRVQV